MGWLPNKRLKLPGPAFGGSVRLCTSQVIPQGGALAPAGARPGVTFKLGADTLEIGGCESFSDAYVTLIFDVTRHVRTLEIFAARP